MVYRSRRRGVGTRVRPYVLVGVVVAVLLAAASLWLAWHPLVPGTQILGVAPLTRVVYDLATPSAAIGLALLVLAWVERHHGLLAFSLGYLVIVLVTEGVGRTVTHPSPWHFLPRLLVTAGVLLLGSLAFVLIRPARKARAMSECNGPRRRLDEGGTVLTTTASLRRRNAAPGAARGASGSKA